MNHLSGVDGRVPFSECEEEAILRVVKLRTVWPISDNTAPASLVLPGMSTKSAANMSTKSSGAHIGIQGYRGRGFHEKKLYEKSPTKLLKLSTSPDSDTETSRSVSPPTSTLSRLLLMCPAPNLDLPFGALPDFTEVARLLPHAYQAVVGLKVSQSEFVFE
jgi:hypothetical protein